MGIRLIFLRHPRHCHRKPSHILKTNQIKHQTKKKQKKFACFVTGEPWEKAGRPELKKQAGRARKAPSPWVHSRLRIDCPPHRMQRQTIAMLGKPNQTKNKRNKQRRKRSKPRKTALIKSWRFGEGAARREGDEH